MPWEVEQLAGSAGELHARPLPQPPRRLVSLIEVDSLAIVLGSSQRATGLSAPGDVEVARRRGGGGAVWLEPGVSWWVDVFVPRADPLHDDDVGRAFWWLGDVFAATLKALGIVGATVHRGPLVAGGPLCFDGVGPGEISVDGLKVVGMTQRRTRAGSRFGCVVYRHYDPVPLAAALGVELGVDVALRHGVGVDELVPGAYERLPGEYLAHIGGEKC